MLQDRSHDVGQTLPALGFDLELSSTLRCQPVKLCVAARLGRTPFSDKKLFVFQAVECGVQRTLLDLQRLFGDHLDALRNRIAVNRPERHDSKNEQMKGALRKVEFG